MADPLHNIVHSPQTRWLFDMAHDIDKMYLKQRQMLRPYTRTHTQHLADYANWKRLHNDMIGAYSQHIPTLHPSEIDSDEQIADMFNFYNKEIWKFQQTPAYKRTYLAAKYNLGEQQRWNAYHRHIIPAAQHDLGIFPFVDHDNFDF